MSPAGASKVEGQLPSDFDAKTYLRLHPDVAAAGVDPGKHYVQHGRNEGRHYREHAHSTGVSDRFVSGPPTDQRVIDIFAGEWSTAFPGLTTKPGHAALTDDARIHWAESVIGPFKDKSVLELGPLEAGHSYMLEKMGADVVAVEANVRSFLKCLCVKEVLGLANVRFLLGDAVSYLEQPGQRFDAIIASGVLYHMLEPLRLLQGIVNRTDRVFIWTHYYDHNRIAQRADRHLFKTPANIDGTKYRGSVRAYPDQAMNWEGFSGGDKPQAVWMLKDDVLAFLENHGFRDIKVQDHPLHENGPSFSICAMR